MELKEGNGIVTLRCNRTVEEAVQKLSELLEAKGIKLFALIDHSGEAQAAGIPMPPTKLLVFGNPKAGTPLMLATPTVAIDLPLKILIWEDGDGKVWVSYNDPVYLQSRHGFHEDLVANIAGIDALAAATAGP